MDINTLTVNEALVAGLFSRGGVDETNAIQLLRNAQAVMAGRCELNTPYDIDVVDDLIITASYNGGVDIYTEAV